MATSEMTFDFVVRHVHEISRSPNPVQDGILQQILTLVKEIRMDQTQMSAKIDELEASAMEQKAKTEAMSAKMDDVLTAAAGLTGDVASMKDQISALQEYINSLPDNSQISPELEAKLSSVFTTFGALSASSDALAAKINLGADQLKALDEATPPVAG